MATRFFHSCKSGVPPPLMTSRVQRRKDGTCFSSVPASLEAWTSPVLGRRVCMMDDGRVDEISILRHLLGIIDVCRFYRQRSDRLSVGKGKKGWLLVFEGAVAEAVKLLKKIIMTYLSYS
ncbi:hypothetical protein CEXT_476421 [Caerostris extrusa]|uniref:LAGLIDADG homing endonuclease n=1 Tax=Caerostris extrusa TaxID=172846 RepID=A0AAV4SN14_CAEEX|nr:hypothetical protein CEXT_476421 [Caerostris extrusa]